MASHTPHALAADPPSLVLNGDFETGDFTGWTLTTTALGALGPEPDLPGVTRFATGENSASSWAATFNVGEDPLTFPGMHTRQGGYLSQAFCGPSGLYAVRLEIANAGVGSLNASGGNFSVALDGTMLDEWQFGANSGAEIQHATLSGSVNLGEGTHILSILIDRPFLATSYGTPFSISTTS